MSQKFVRSIVFVAALAGLAAPALAHHSFGEFQMDVPLKLSGTLTDMHFVNPHSYMEIDAVDASGKKVHMRCEMRAATLLKRSGWSAEMFKGVDSNRLGIGGCGSARRGGMCRRGTAPRAQRCGLCPRARCSHALELDL